MNVCFNNVDFSSSSGPNQFASKLAFIMHELGHSIMLRGGDVQLSFISTARKYAPVVLRLDGIYFNTEQDWKRMNKPIRRSYNDAEAVIIQSEFDLQLITKYFGDRDNLHVISNGTMLDKIESIARIDDVKLEKYSEVWCCASHWRPHKRLNDNLRYFNEHAPEDACIIIAGNIGDNLDESLKDDRMFFVGDIVWTQLVGLFKRSDKFVHLSWLDHCPNVVVDARACGCQIVCSSAGGTREIAGSDAIVVAENTWDFSPTELYSPPPLDFSRISNTGIDSNLDMKVCAQRYLDVLQGISG